MFFLINIKILLPKVLYEMFIEYFFKIKELRFIVLVINNLMQKKVVISLSFE